MSAIGKNLIYRTLFTFVKLMTTWAAVCPNYGEYAPIVLKIDSDFAWIKGHF